MRYVLHETTRGARYLKFGPLACAYRNRGA